MKRKVIGLVVALVLAAVGTLALTGYVKTAKDEAVAGEELVDVYVLDQTVEKGATADEIRSALKVEQVPIKVRAADAITDPSLIGDDAVAAVDLQSGEQLLASRIVGEETLTRVPVPPGLQELTISLEPQRAVGGELRPGDTVGVLLSFEPFELDASGAEPSPTPETTAPVDPAVSTTEGPKKTPNTTHLTLHKVLVTQVQFTSTGSSPIGGDDDSATPDDVGTAPTTNVLVTLAVTGAEAEQVVFAGEFGRIWLTAENEAADTGGTRIVTLGEAFDEGLLR